VHQPNDLYRAFFDATNDSVVIADAACGTIVDANLRALIDTAYSRDELHGIRVGRLFQPSDEIAARALERSDGDVSGLRLLTKTGSVIAVDARLTPVRMHDRRFVFIAIRKGGAGACAGTGETDVEDSGHEDVPGIIGRSERIRDVCRRAASVARSDATVLIQGASGTGKEVVANAIHTLSGRRHRPFVKVNCAALTETLLESELFGHVKGAFTGAIRDRRGRFKQADGGTILLDEIGSMPLAGQATLLRVLQEREFEPVGSSQTIPVDVRVIAATNTDLGSAVAAGAFRADLYYRLNVFGMSLPPLRERLEDVPLLARHFLRRYGGDAGRRITGIAPDALSILVEHDWPGNVRELENAIEHAAIVETGPVIMGDSLPAALRKSGAGAETDSEPADLGLRERLMRAERQILLDTLARANGVRKRAAEMLGIDSRNMPYFLRKHRLQDELQP
jgi:PAS domain S-box-containing protein